MNLLESTEKQRKRNGIEFEERKIEEKLDLEK